LGNLDEGDAICRTLKLDPSFTPRWPAWRRLSTLTHLSPPNRMITLRVTRHDRNEALLAECQSTVIPARGEVLQLDTIDAEGTMIRGTMWRVIAVTVHVPSLQSSEPLDGTPLRVRTVEVSVLPDVSLLPALEAAAEEVLSESRL
jgi:hypothetical protein